MINTKLIYKIIGSLLFIEATMMFYCLAVALYYKEDDLVAFGVSILLIAMWRHCPTDCSSGGR